MSTMVVLMRVSDVLLYLERLTPTGNKAWAGYDVTNN